MKATFETWRVLGMRKAYAGMPYGVDGLAVRVSGSFGKNHFGNLVRVAVLRFSRIPFYWH